MTINFSTLYTRIGKFAYAGSILVTALGTTIEDEVEDAVQELGGSNSLEYELAREGVLTGLRALQSSASGALASCVQTPCQRLLIQTVKDDNQLPADTLALSLAELERQMRVNLSSLDASTITVTVTYGSTNEGNGLFVTTVKRADGLVNEHSFDEDISAICTTAPTNGLAQFSLSGELAVGITEYNWPQGSGSTATITSHTADSNNNLVTNGGFETENSTQSHLPNGWICSVGTLGTTLKMTSVEVQTVIISGSPGSGSYVLHFVDRDGISRTTVPLAYNATGTAVQTALQAITGLGSVTVVTTGVSPDYTHTITFTGVPNPSQLTSTSALGGGGSIAHATSTAGSANVIRGARAVEFDSDGSQLTTLNVPVTLGAKTRYAINLFALADVVPAAGVMTVDLVDGIGGTVIKDDQNVQNSLKFQCADLTTSFQSLSALLSAVNEVQTLSSTATGGTFTLSFNGETTGNIAFDASAATVKAALEALNSIDVDEVSCGGGAIPGTPITITFLGKWAAQDIPPLVVDNTLATGGTAAIAETTKGNPGQAVFRTPSTLPASVYLRIRISTAISNGTSVFIDEVCMVEMTSLYTGGPAASAFTGRNLWALNDTANLAVANNRAGLLNEWLNRIFDLRTSEILLPTNSVGSETIADSLVG